MADKNNVNPVNDKIRQMLEKLGEAFDEWLAKQRPKQQLAPIPIDRPYRRKKIKSR